MCPTRLDDAQILDALQRSHAAPFSLARNLALVDQVPDGLRLLHYTRSTIPAE